MLRIFLSTNEVYLQKKNETVASLKVLCDDKSMQLSFILLFCLYLEYHKTYIELQQKKNKRNGSQGDSERKSLLLRLIEIQYRNSIFHRVV